MLDEVLGEDLRQRVVDDLRPEAVANNDEAASQVGATLGVSLLERLVDAEMNAFEPGQDLGDTVIVADFVGRVLARIEGEVVDEVAPGAEHLVRGQSGRIQVQPRPGDIDPDNLSAGRGGLPSLDG